MRATTCQTPTDPKDVPYPPFWIVTPKPLSAEPGMHRFVWDFHVGDPDGPLAAPGTYVVRLSLGGSTYSQHLVLRRDPRIAATDADLIAQTTLALEVEALGKRVALARADAKTLRAANPAAVPRIDAIVGAAHARDPDDSTDAGGAVPSATLRSDAGLLESWKRRSKVPTRVRRRTSAARGSRSPRERNARSRRSTRFVAACKSGDDGAPRRTRALLGIALPLPAGSADESAIGAHGAVATDQRLASETGIRVLRAGGNAVDAAVAIGYTLAVTFPEAGNLGGGGFMLVRLANRDAHFIDFRETAPAAATAHMYLDAHGNVVPDASVVGPLSAGVPGSVAGLEYARAKYGTQPRHELMRDALAYAERGFPTERCGCEGARARAETLSSVSEQALRYSPPAATRLRRERCCGNPTSPERCSRIDAEGAARVLHGR